MLLPWILCGLFLSTAAGAAPAAEPAGPVASEVAPAAAAAPRVPGRLRAVQLGLVVNDEDPYSVAVGAHYQSQRGLAESQVLHVRLAVQPQLPLAALDSLRERIAAHFGPDIQALALAWRQPYAVQCNAITAAVSLGFDAAQCRQGCGKGSDSPYFNSGSDRPFSRHGMRPSMLLAASDETEARRMIDRGVASDARLGRMLGPVSQALYISTADAARNVRAPLFPRAGAVGGTGLTIRTPAEADAVAQRWDDVILVQTGTANLRGLERLHFLPGALADHLTSAGGVLDGSGRQSTALAWITAGATASYGTVSEPCNHLQKFPHPQLLLLHYLQGETALEAYWKSVLWPAQGLFIGEPLAAPFASPFDAR